MLFNRKCCGANDVGTSPKIGSKERGGGEEILGEEVGQGHRKTDCRYNTNF